MNFSNRYNLTIRCLSACRTFPESRILSVPNTNTFSVRLFDPRTPSSDIVLAHLILKEKYDTAPQLVPLVGSIDAALQKTDAVLVSGDEAIEQGDRTNRIDLVDEWSDVAELPYIHGVWVTREGALTKEEVDAVARSAQAASTSREEIANDEHRDYLSRFTYDLTDEVVAALTESFRMAYYHGILQDIPEVKVRE